MIFLLGVASALFFGGGLIITESFSEFAHDIDLKPFFILYLLIAFSRYGLPTLSIALSGAIGEGVLDVFEGYEMDDPIGFIGYVIGFIAFGWYLNEIAEDPTTARSLSIAAILGGGFL